MVYYVCRLHGVCSCSIRHNGQLQHLLHLPLYIGFHKCSSVWQQPIHALPLLTEVEQQQLLAWNDTTIDSKIPVLLTQSSLKSGLPETRAQVVCLDAEAEKLLWF
ncbi:MAG: hypothetical protein GY862_04115 [Gammaproteobacteria bacterium]|nr:hypothetical protein [Gammaproteobacteria bacterium]